MIWNEDNLVEFASSALARARYRCSATSNRPASIQSDTRTSGPLPAPNTEVKPGAKTQTPHRAVSTLGQDNHPRRRENGSFAPKSKQQHGAHCLMPYLIRNTGCRGASRAKSLRSECTVTSKNGRTTGTCARYVFRTGAASSAGSSWTFTISDRRPRCSVTWPAARAFLTQPTSP